MKDVLETIYVINEHASVSSNCCASDMYNELNLFLAHLSRRLKDELIV